MGKKILIASLGSDAGGIEKSLISFLSFALSEGHEVDLCLWKKPGILFGQIPDKVNIINTETLYPGSLRNNKKTPLYLLWYVMFRLMQLIGLPSKVFKSLGKQYDIAVCYCQNGYSPYFVIDKVKARKKYFWYHHGSYEKRFFGRLTDRLYLPKYDRIITVSTANKVMLEKNMPYLKGKIDVIRNLSDVNSIRSSGERFPEEYKGKSNIIVTVGRISPEKGQLFCLETAETIKRSFPEFFWFFIGEGPDKEKCLAFIKERDLGNCCFFLGEKDDPYPYMNHAKLYVQASSVEADPITIREALILRETIIASDIPAMSEILGGGRYGILCPLDKDRFAETIIRKLSEKSPDSFPPSDASDVNEESVEAIRALFE